MANARTKLLPDVEEALASRAFYRNPYPLYRALRERMPVYWSAFLNQWLVTSYDLAEEVFLNPAAFSNHGFESRLHRAAPCRVPDRGRHTSPSLQPGRTRSFRSAEAHASQARGEPVLYPEGSVAARGANPDSRQASASECEGAPWLRVRKSSGIWHSHFR